MRPRTRPGYVQMITAGFGREAAASVGRDPIPKARFGSYKPSVRVLPLPLCPPLTVYEHTRHVVPPFGRRLSAFSRQRSASPPTTLQFGDKPILSDDIAP